MKKPIILLYRTDESFKGPYTNLIAYSEVLSTFISMNDYNRHGMMVYFKNKIVELEDYELSILRNEGLDFYIDENGTHHCRDYNQEGIVYFN